MKKYFKSKHKALKMCSKNSSLKKTSTSKHCQVLVYT